MNQPTTFRAGDSVSWTVSLPDYPASAGWSLKYRLLWPTGDAKEIESTAAGDEYAVALTSSDTSTWAAGSATLVTVVEKNDERKTLSADPVTVLPDLGSLSTYDSRSLTKRTLDDLKQALANYAAAEHGHVEEYEVAGRRMKFRSVDDIKQLISYYTVLVAKDNATDALLSGGQPPGRCYYRG